MTPSIAPTEHEGQLGIQINESLWLPDDWIIEASRRIREFRNDRALEIDPPIGIDSEGGSHD